MVGRRPRWSPAVKETAAQIHRETGGDIGQASARLEAEHGLTIPPQTLRRWARDTGPDPSTATVQGTAQRLISLCASELSRIERTPPAQRDLDRAGKVAQILKTVEPLARTKAQARRSLSDLTPGDADGSDDA